MAGSFTWRAPRRLRAAALGLAAAAATSAAWAAKVPAPTASGGAFTVGVTSWRDLPFRTVVRQQFDYSCGSAALATLLHFHYRQPVREADIFTAMFKAGDQAKIRKVGFSLLDMKKYLAASGFSADGYRIPLDEFQKMGTPAIALVRTGAYRHFVVIKGVRGGQVLVGDPALGLRIYRRTDFERMWSGILLVIDDAHAGRFNAPEEWAQRSPPRASPYAGEPVSAALMRDLPTLYQITPVANIIPIQALSN